MRDGIVNLVMKSSALDELSILDIARSVIVQYVKRRLPLFARIANAFAQYADISCRRIQNKKEAKMLTVTESARQHLKNMLLAHSDDPEIGLRLTVEPPRQFGLVLDREGVGDQVVEHEGAKVLLVASELVTLLSEVTIDAQDTPEGTKLVISKE